MFERLKRFFGGGEISAATQLPPPADPKTVKSGQTILPSYLPSKRVNAKTALRAVDRRLASTDITTLRSLPTTPATLREFRRASPDLSAAVTSYIRVGITNGWTAYAKNLDGTFNPEATSALHQIVSRMDVLNDYSLGFDDSLSIRALSEVWANEIMTYGRMCGELVLNKARLPDKIQPITSTQVQNFPSSDGKRLIPKQLIAGEEISLDIPTFFMVSIDQDLQTSYPDSPIEPALQSVQFSAEFMNDLRRIVKRAIHPRVVLTIDEEKFRKAIPPQLLLDNEKLREYMDSVIAGAAEQINGLEPEQALVLFDSFEFKVEDHGNTGLSEEWSVLQEIANSKMASGAKVLPTVLGHAGSTSNVASTEALVFVKYVEGTVWGKLNEMFSKIFTLAVRLLGHDVVCSFTFNAINLKPEEELESFKALKQSRILTQLSLGLIEDDEAAIALTGHLPPKGMRPLSGTGFMPATAAEPAGDGNNGASNSGSTLNQKTKSDAPKGGARGQNKQRV